MTNQIHDYLVEKKLDAFLVLTKINRQYLSGFTGSAGYLVISKREAVLYVDGRYFLRAKKESGMPVRKLERLSKDLVLAKYKKIAIEDRISLREFASLKKIGKGVSWKSTANVIENVRAVKTKAQLKAIERGSAIIDKTFEQIKKYIRAYINKYELTEAKIAGLILKYGTELDAEGLAFDPIVAFGSNAASPHHFPSKTRVGRNNFLLLDFGFKVGNYHSDFTRTLFLGRPTGFQAKVYETVLHSQLKAIAKVQIGNKASLFDQTARKVITQAGFGKYFTHNTGHGVGLEIHEQPNFSPASEDVLKVNSVVTVEPGIYLPGKFGVRIEDMITVAKQPKIHSKIPKDLKSMII